MLVFLSLFLVKIFNFRQFIYMEYLVPLVASCERSRVSFQLSKHVSEIQLKKSLQSQLRLDWMRAQFEYDARRARHKPYTCITYTFVRLSSNELLPVLADCGKHLTREPLINS